eukprot:CAMPEP_0202839628 /NCGR_PEP_ID=MMETSP1389-20130828/53247_1 /ASSEMBLY_ACC=CAM_ASM_000865 /TAXON_ID=302021 /ORGANISM="Rhodomonas sp., Strain CCMP768" /LENGTH=267 /DNA_ID=CAMNT_0049516125 /DNA_START=11 /DNA_END=813 /DNA_ORIENTATION=+
MSVCNIRKAALNQRGYRDLLHWREDPSNVYIGRDMSHYVPGANGSKWANPFPVKTHGRDGCLDKYKKYIEESPLLLSALPELEGKNLGCWCHPEPCHGHVLRTLLAERTAQGAGKQAAAAVGCVSQEKSGGQGAEMKESDEITRRGKKRPRCSVQDQPAGAEAGHAACEDVTPWNEIEDLSSSLDPTLCCDSLVAKLKTLVAHLRRAPPTIAVLSWRSKEDGATGGWSGGAYLPGEGGRLIRQGLLLAGPRTMALSGPRPAIASRTN